MIIAQYFMLIKWHVQRSVFSIISKDDRILSSLFLISATLTYVDGVQLYSGHKFRATVIHKMKYARNVWIVANNVTIFKHQTAVHMCQWQMQRFWPLSRSASSLFRSWKLHELIIEWMSDENLNTSDMANQHQLLWTWERTTQRKQTSRIKLVHLQHQFLLI